MEEDPYLAQLGKSIHWPRGSFKGYRTEEGALKDRVIKHDVLHLLIAGMQRSRPLHLKFEDEYAVAIVQAVLEGKGKLSKKNCSHHCQRDVPGNEIITNDCVRQETLRQTMEFMVKELKNEQRKLPSDFRHNVSDEFIEYHRQVAEQFRSVFKQTYGTEFVSMDIEQFIRIPFDDLEKIYQAADQHAKQNIPVILEMKFLRTPPQSSAGICLF